jgi:hypothetical protein
LFDAEYGLVQTQRAVEVFKYLDVPDGLKCRQVTKSLKPFHL